MTWLKIKNGILNVSFRIFFSAATFDNVNNNSFSYIIFGMVGFGTALIASPVLLNFLPLSQIIPLLALLDMFAAISNVIKDGKKADFSELKFLIPLMFVGSFLGFILLMRVNASYALLAFGIFTLLYAIYSLSGFKPQKKLEKKFVFPFGLSGGFLGAMFGSGGFLYAIYLNGRIETPENPCHSNYINWV